MIFTIAKNKLVGYIRRRVSYCITPLKFEDKIYWLHKVYIKEQFTKDYHTLNVDGFWKIINVSTKG